jgi:hypothetical protein
VLALAGYRAAFALAAFGALGLAAYARRGVVAAPAA